MSVFATIKALKGDGQLEEAWQYGFEALQEDRQNTYLQTTLFWIVYAALKQKVDPIKQRKNAKPLPAEQSWIDAWVTRISELNLALPNENIDYRLWNIFLKAKDVGQFCTPLCLYVLVSGRKLFRPDDYIPYRTEIGESPSLVCKLARMVAANYLQHRDNSLVPVGRVTGFLQYAFEATQDAAHKIWICYDKANVLAASGQMERARQAYLDVLEKKRSESWAWFGLATTYQDEPAKASSLIAHGLTCAHDPKYSVRGLYLFANLMAQQANYADASRSLLRLNSIYQINSWPLKKEIAELMANSWYDASLDEAALDGTIQTLAASANHYVVQHPIVYRGIVAAIHKSGKGADIYISPKQISPVFKRLFQTHEAFRPGAFVELLCDKRSDEDTPISVKEIERFTSENICAYSGVLALKEKGFGFVDSVFVPPFLIGAHTNGEEVAGIAVMKFNKVKNTTGLSAITIRPAN